MQDKDNTTSQSIFAEIRKRQGLGKIHQVISLSDKNGTKMRMQSFKDEMEVSTWLKEWKRDGYTSCVVLVCFGEFEEEEEIDLEKLINQNFEII